MAVSRTVQDIDLYSETWLAVEEIVARKLGVDCEHVTQHGIPAEDTAFHRGRIAAFREMTGLRRIKESGE